MPAVAVRRFASASVAQRIWTRPRRKRGGALIRAQGAARVRGSQRRRASLRFEPPSPDVELHRIERLGAHALAGCMRARYDPAIGFEPVDLELRAGGSPIHRCPTT